MYKRQLLDCAYPEACLEGSGSLLRTSLTDLSDPLACVESAASGPSGRASPEPRLARGLCNLGMEGSLDVLGREDVQSHTDVPTLECDAPGRTRCTASASVAFEQTLVPWSTSPRPYTDVGLFEGMFLDLDVNAASAPASQELAAPEDRWAVSGQELEAAL